MISYAKEAFKFLEAQGKTAAKRLYAAIERLPEGDIKKLHGAQDPPLYRLRVGGFRVLFHFDGADFFVLRIDTRGDVYKRL